MDFGLDLEENGENWEKGMRILKRIEECVRAPFLVLLRESIKVGC